jgi:hypothetical protein
LCKKPNTAFFEFGCSIGRKFKYLPLPTSDHVLGIGIPQEQKIKYKDDSKFSFGQLEELEELVHTLKEESQIQLRIINHIQYIYEKIEEVYKGSSYVNQYWMNKPLERAKKICSLLIEE